MGGEALNIGRVITPPNKKTREGWQGPTYVEARNSRYDGVFHRKYIAEPRASVMSTAFREAVQISAQPLVTVARDWVGWGQTMAGGATASDATRILVMNINFLQNTPACLIPESLALRPMGKAQCACAGPAEKSVTVIVGESFHDGCSVHG